jgi:hypothetical protein
MLWEKGKNVKGKDVGSSPNLLVNSTCFSVSSTVTVALFYDIPVQSQSESQRTDRKRKAVTKCQQICYTSGVPSRLDLNGVRTRKGRTEGEREANLRDGTQKVLPFKHGLEQLIGLDPPEGLLDGHRVFWRARGEFEG